MHVDELWPHIYPWNGIKFSQGEEEEEEKEKEEEEKEKEGG